MAFFCLTMLAYEPAFLCKYRQEWLGSIFTHSDSRDHEYSVDDRFVRDVDLDFRVVSH